MLRQIWFLFLICFASFSAFAQTEDYTAPVKWERYKVSDKDVSVLMPKLPVLFESLDVCSEQETKKYAAYAHQTVYGFAISSKIKGKLPYLCSPQKKFGEKNFQERLTELKTLLKESTETNFTQDNLIVNKISAANSTYWLINDFENKRWFEFSVTGGNEEKPEVKNFLKSFIISKNAQGIEIENGADRTLGDEVTKISEPKNGETASLIVVFKTQPKYTKEARQAEIQGTVRLKVTFSGTGGIGSIEPVTALPYGLTEQAIAAARKIVFIPMKRDGKSVSASKIIEYSFSIY